MAMGSAREISSAPGREESHGWRNAGWKDALASLGRAVRRIVVQPYVPYAGSLWRSSRSQAEGGHETLELDGTHESLAPAFMSRRSDAGGAALVHATSLAAVSHSGPIGRQSQVGKTTALVHDLNNLLSIVQANLQLLDREIFDEDQRALIKDAHDATELCDEVIRRLHAERSGPVTRRLPLDINEELSLIADMIQKRCGPGIEVEYRLAKNLGMTSTDPALFLSACLNLVANARDAMTAHGRLVITTSNVELDASSALNHIDAAPGAYVRLSFRDTGPGIPAETLQRIFEPYFSTKTTGRCLGVGLTLVREFCQQFEGFVRVESRRGRGTTVSVYLPRHSVRQASI